MPLKALEVCERHLDAAACPTEHEDAEAGKQEQSVLATSLW